jgi:hypothetical protein
LSSEQTNKKTNFSFSEERNKQNKNKKNDTDKYQKEHYDITNFVNGAQSKTIHLES